MAKDAYQTLGVARDADKEAIKLAYYDLRRQFAALKRPTRPQNERLIRINAAWDILKIPERKAEYDRDLERLAKARRDRDEAATRKREREAAAPPPPPPEPEPEPDPEAVEEDAPSYDQNWQPAAPRPRRSKPVSSMVWKLGTAVGALYVVASIMKPAPIVPPPATEMKAEALPKKAPAKARRTRKRKAPQPSIKDHRRSHDTQDAAELNRRELERLRTVTGEAHSEGFVEHRSQD